MARDAIIELAKDVRQLATAGVEGTATTKLAVHARTLKALSQQTPALAPLADAAQRTLDAEPDEVPAPLLDLLQGAVQARTELADVAPVPGEIKDFPEGGFWATPMPAEVLYTLVPETRPFAKRAKPPEQIENIESAARRGQIADLRLVQPFLKMLTEKAGNTVADTAARVAVPAFGPTILPDLWPTLGPENRTFVAAHKIDAMATVARLLEKPADKKKAVKAENVIKAVEKLMTTVSEDGTSIGPDSLPIIKQALKHAPDQAFRRKLADILANMGSAAAEVLPDLIDAFEHTGLSRDYYLVRPLVVLGKESQDVADALIRAMGDRDHTVRLMAVFNMGQMGSVALGSLQIVEDLAESDPDSKVREQAVKTLNKLRIRFDIPEPEPATE
jgi:hypothetical protein